MRHLEATNARFKKHGWVDVMTESSPETGFTYRVINEGRSSYIRRGVLLPVLKAERTLTARGDGAGRALTRTS